MLNKQKIGIMGGTFDPVHYGHLVIAESARSEFGLEKIIFIPTGEPPHKKAYRITDAEDRYNMVQMAIADNDNFAISRIEIERPGPSYTVDTLMQLHSLHPEIDPYIITGADAIVEILTWKNVSFIAALCHFIAATRPGYSLDRLNQEINGLPPVIRQKILTIEIPGVAISSTEIRKRLAENKPISYLLPGQVEKYIRQKKLYQF